MRSGFFLTSHLRRSAEDARQDPLGGKVGKCFIVNLLLHLRLNAYKLFMRTSFIS